ncbi:MAG: lipocalin-like domain-containing protein [Anaerolineales bacterium]
MQDNPFVGVWKLISCDAIRKNGSVLPVYGKNPVGRLYYDAAGNMSVHMMKSGRPNFKDQTKFRATSLEMRVAYESYEAYFSTYEIDEENHVVNHKVLGGLFPNWTGTIQVRHYKFDGNRLIMSTDPIGYISKEKTVLTLVWERLE